MADEIQEEIKKEHGELEQATEENKAETGEKEDTVPPSIVRNSIEEIEKAAINENTNFTKYPPFGVGDTIKVYVKIIEGDKQRIQPYEGIVIAMKHGGIRKSFIVRRISYGVAIERIFPFYSPYIEKIELVRKGRVRRSKIYYLRGRFGKSAVISEKV
jgi:large subunit ribosomal protein L19